MGHPSTGSGADGDHGYVVKERDFYRKLLELGMQDEIAPFIEEALALIIDLAGARRGYLELHDETREPEAPRFWIARGCTDDDVGDIRAMISHGIIAEAIATRQTIIAASASEDPRFRNRVSVRRNRIEAVLCAPIGVDAPLGVIYLQERIEPGPFDEVARRHAETFARHISPFVDRLLVRRRRDEIDPTEPLRRALRVEGLVGRSEAVADVLRHVALVAPRDVTVLISGACGTGKTQLARMIHQNSRRSAGPFVEVNCAAIPETLIESELFGAEKGAHSAALRKIEGKVASAQRGTLFLDEVGELSRDAQAKLLQLLQSKTYSPLGPGPTLTADVRFIAATNADLKAAVAQRRFREDLYYRLHVLPIRMPSLTERREDIAHLATRFCDLACAGGPSLRLSPGALRALEAADWPGNVRELENAVTAAVLRAGAENATQIERRHVFPAGPDAGSVPATRLTYQQALRQCQEQILRDTLEATGWNVTEAAKLLDVTRAHVYNLIHAFGLARGR